MGATKRMIVAITGPTGSGKSTVASKLAKQIEKCVNIDADHLKHMVVSGFIYDKSPDGIKQWELLGENIGLLAYNFQEAGYNVIINGYINEPAWKNIAKHIDLTHKFLLLPHLDKVKSRDKERHEDFIMGDKAVLEHHDYFSTADFYKDFTKIDSADHNVEQTVDQVLTIIRAKSE